MSGSLQANRSGLKPPDPSNWLHDFQPPAFLPHRILRGGHLQTLVSPRLGQASRPCSGTHQKLSLNLPCGDQLILHEDVPLDWQAELGSVLLVHGICGCHGASYMIRFHRRLNQAGIRTYRLDMRGCGDSGATCRSITHAGRSEDVLSAIDFIGGRVNDPSSPIGAVGVSLGGNQLLRGAGRVGAGLDVEPNHWNRVGPIVAIAPPIDLQRCSDTMEAFRLRFYNRYFITHLLRRASKPLRQISIYQAAVAAGRPRTLKQFDRQFTAPLGGFQDEQHYYAESSASRVLEGIQIPTMIVAAADDPLVPVQSFHSVAGQLSTSTRLLVMPTGGHHGFIQADRTAWTDDLIVQLFSAAWRTR